MKKRFWTSKEKNHRVFRLYPPFLWVYTYERLKLEESSWKPCEYSCSFPDWARKIQILFPQFFSPLCKRLSQLLFIFWYWSIPILKFLSIVIIQLYCISLQYWLPLCQNNFVLSRAIFLTFPFTSQCLKRYFAFLFSRTFQRYPWNILIRVSLWPKDGRLSLPIS